MGTIDARMILPNQCFFCERIGYLRDTCPELKQMIDQGIVYVNDWKRLCIGGEPDLRPQLSLNG